MASSLEALDAAALIRMGLSLQTQGRLQEAAVVMFKACKKQPTSYDAHLFMGHLLCDLNRARDALDLYRRAASLAQSKHQAHLGLASALQEIQDHSGAVASFASAVACAGLQGSELADAYFNWANSLSQIGKKSQAVDKFEESIKTSETPEACNNLGDLLWELGDIARALKFITRSCELAPESNVFLQNKLMLLNYMPDVPWREIYDAHVAWGDRISKDAPAFHSWDEIVRDPDRRLRIAYLSPDYCWHPTCFFARCLVEHHQQEAFDVFLFSNTTRQDKTTEFFKSSVTEGRWKCVVGMAAQQVAELIREEHIDILVDLAGHTANNRLDVLALKPAPVQFTWCGYQNTTGLRAIDYLITDPIVDPPDTEQLFAEELARLPKCINCYTPPAGIPDVATLPADSNDGNVTFGSFTNISKLSPSCISLWAQLLQDLPGSRLMLKAKGFSSDEVQARVARAFEDRGVASDRLLLRPFSQDHLQTYTSEVDIALDTFPYSSPTTACEAVLMGVPVICLAGGTHCSRRALTVVAALGLEGELAGSTPEAYSRLAMQLATDLPRLSALRRELRPMLLRSPLCDGCGFVRDGLEPLLRQKWRLYCEGRPPSVHKLRES